MKPAAQFFASQMNKELLYDMLVSFFKSQASDKGDRLVRRPPVGMRLVDGEGYIFTVRPGWKEPDLQWTWTDTDKVLEIIERTYTSRLHGRSTKRLAVIECWQPRLFSAVR